MKKLFYVLMMGMLITQAGLAFASKNNFQFQVNGYYTERQSGQMLDMYIRYAMKDDVQYSKYPDYRELRAIALRYLKPTARIPKNTYWEIIAAKIAEDLMSHYPLSGISIQLLIYPNENQTIFEPDFHGPIYTIGDVIPFSQTVIPDDR